MKSDTQLQQDVIAELQWEPSIEASTIGVETKDGIVTLAGHVDSFPQKWAAERAAQRVAGVKGVVVEIDVALPGSSKRRDADLVRTASHALEWNASIPPDAVRISVQDGWVTLSGEVDWDYQRREAVRTVRNLVGVNGLSDTIKVKPRLKPDDVKTKIEAALQRHAHLQTKEIQVAIKDGSVTLSGNVDSWAERDAARMAAWAAPGVKDVVDNLNVVN